MAKKKTEPVYTGKYTLEDMTSIDLDTLGRMNRKELAKVVSRMQDISKKRLKRLEDKGELTPAYHGLMDQSGKGDLSVKGKSLNELRGIYKQQKSFLTAKTSTVKGAESVKRAEAERLGISFEDSDSANAFWNAYNKFIETAEGKQALYNRGSAEVQKIIAQMFTDEYTEDEIMDYFQNMYEDDEYEEDDSYDDFFDLDDW